MQRHIIIFESLVGVSHVRIRRLLRKGHQVGVLKPGSYSAGALAPFSAEHPAWVKKEIQEGSIQEIDHVAINSRWIREETNDLAVSVIEPFYTKFFSDREREFISLFSGWLDENYIRRAFKKEILYVLVDVVEILLIQKRLKVHFGTDDFVFATARAIPRPQVFINGVAEFSKQFSQLGDGKEIQYSVDSARINSVMRALKDGLVLCGVFFLAFLTLFRRPFRVAKSFQYGVTLDNPVKNLDKARSPLFFVDGKSILLQDCVLLMDGAPTESQKSYMKQKGYTYFFNRYAIDPALLRRAPHLIYATLKAFFRGEYFLIRAYRTFAYTYGRWEGSMKRVSLNHFITSHEASAIGIIRNGLLKNHGVKTWIFSYSLNSGLLYVQPDGIHQENKDPYYAYYTYDYSLFWCLAEYNYQILHHQEIGNPIVIGSVWSGVLKELRSDNTPRSFRDTLVAQGLRDDMKIISVFDTSFLEGSLYDQHHGAAFVNDMLWLLEQYKDIFIVFKPKKDFSTHPTAAQELVRAYELLAAHQRVFMPAYTLRPTGFIALSNLVISFPYTSATFEALGARIPAIYHDPLGKFKNMPYARINGLTSHNKEDLSALVTAYLYKFDEQQFDAYLERLKKEPYLDGYFDGGAVQRFRELLLKENARL